MEQRSRLLIALDTNVLFDLADGKDFAETVLEVLREKRALLKVSPTVFVELQFQAECGSTPQKRARAEKALESMRKWGMTPFILADVQQTIATEFSNALRRAGLIPEDEFNDGCILGEAALCPVEYLLTSDSHLLSIDRPKLRKLFEARDLPVVEILSVRDLFRLLR